MLKMSNTYQEEETFNQRSFIFKMRSITYISLPDCSKIVPGWPQRSATS